MDWIDQKYIGLIGQRLERFAKRGSSYNFRCPLCGDSQKNKFKTRGYLMEKPIGVLYYCHNCHASMKLGTFLEHVDSNIAADYNKERFEERYNQQGKKEEKPDLSKIVIPAFLKGDSPLKKLKKISQLVHDHPAKRYIEQRKIPTTFHHKLFYAPKFKAYVNELIPEKFDLETGDEPRLIIPFIDMDGTCYGFQGRNFKKDGIRYITIILDSTKPKVFGLDSVDFAKQIYITEGPIDSMFLPNALAMAGSDSINVVDGLSVDKQLVTFVYDNERRNKEIIRVIEKAIERGYNICLWPDHITQKDINEMVLAGMKPADIKLIIDNNTYSGLQAQVALASWSKV
jgi:hypothetical protein